MKRFQLFYIKSILQVYKNLSIAKKVIFVLISIVLASSLGAGFFTYKSMTKNAESMLGLRLQHIAQTGVNMIDISSHQKIIDDYLAQNENVTKSKQFLDVQNALKKVKISNDLSSDVYTLINPEFDKEFAIFIGTSNDNPYTGNAVALTKFVKKVIETKKPGYSELYRDEEGVWVSGYAPILTSDGAVQGVIEVDYRADAEVHEARNQILRNIGIPALISILGALFIGSIFGHAFAFPIRNLQVLAQDVAAGNLDNSVTVLSTDEIGNLGQAFNKMISDLRQSRQELKNYAENLEVMVAERTEELRKANQTIQAMLDNMQLSVFVADEKQNIIAPVSKFSSILFNDKIEGKTIFDTIYKDIPHNSEQYANCNTAFLSVFGEGDLQWELMEEHFPKKINYERKSGSSNEETKIDRRSLKLNYTPLYDEEGLMQRILFVIEDLTEMERLEAETSKAKAANEELTLVLSQLAIKENQDLVDFFDNSKVLLDKIQRSVVRSYIDNKELESVFRDLHTLKGNSRVYNFNFIANCVHEVESKLAELKKRFAQGEAKVTVGDIKQLMFDISDIKMTAKKYTFVMKSIFRLEDIFYSSTEMKMLELISAVFDLKKHHEVLHDKEKIVELYLKNSHWVFEVRELQEISKKYGNFSNTNVIDQNLQSFISNIGETTHEEIPLKKFSQFEYATIIIISELFNRVSKHQIINEKDLRIELFFEFFRLVDFGKIASKEELLFRCLTISSLANQLNLLSISKNFEKVVQDLNAENDLFREDNTKLKSKIKQSMSILLVDTLCEVVNWRQQSELKNYVFDFNHYVQGQMDNKDISFVNALIRLKVENYFTDSFSTAFGKLFGLESVKEIWDLLLNSNLSQLQIEKINITTETTSFENLQKQIKNHSTLFIDQLGEVKKVYDIILESVGNDFNFAMDVLRVFNTNAKNQDSELGTICKTISLYQLTVENLNKTAKLYENENVISTKKLVQATHQLFDVPAGSMIKKYYGMVEEISKDVKKEIKLNVDGFCVLLPKNVSEPLDASLLHLIRNSIDHGIELPEDREKVKKTKYGNIGVKFQLNEKELFLEVTDDGKGIDPELVWKSAVRKAMVRQEQRENFTTAQVLDLIFMPEFSTKTEVSTLSGRGVGMDVVKKSIESLGGQIEMSSVVGTGTKFVVKVPLDNDHKGS